MGAQETVSVGLPYPGWPLVIVTVIAGRGRRRFIRKLLWATFDRDYALERMMRQVMGKQFQHEEQ